MSRLDPKIVVHHLVVDLKIKPIRQKLRKIHSKVALLVKVELEKMLAVKVIHPIDYSKWISNIVLVSKAFGDIIIYTDFRDLKKACPKDDFPLPNFPFLNIDMLVDLIARHKILSLMDGFRI